MPAQEGNIAIKFPITQAGNYTFVLTDLYGVFKGKNSTQHFSIPANSTTSLTVM